MAKERYYDLPEWARLRAAVIRRSRGQCEAPGCTAPGVVVDHIVSRRRSGSDELGNLRHLCRWHDNEIKEGANGERRSKWEALGTSRLRS